MRHARTLQAAALVVKVAGTSGGVATGMQPVAAVMGAAVGLGAPSPCVPLAPAVPHGRAAAAPAPLAAAIDFAPELGASADSIDPDEEGQDAEARAAERLNVYVKDCD